MKRDITFVIGMTLYTIAALQLGGYLERERAARRPVPVPPLPAATVAVDDSRYNHNAATFRLAVQFKEWPDAQLHCYGMSRWYDGNAPEMTAYGCSWVGSPIDTPLGRTYPPIGR